MPESMSVLRQATRLEDWDQFLEAVQPWDVSGCIATDRNQPFRAEVKGVVGESFYAIRINLNRRFHQNGATPAGYSNFALMTSVSTPARYRRQDAFPRVGLSVDHEFEGASEPGFDVILFGIANEAYHNHFAGLESPLADLSSLNADMLESTRDRIQRFEALAGRLMADPAGHNPGDNEAERICTALLEGLEGLVVAQAESEASVPSTVARRRALNRGLDFIQGNLKNTITIREICSYAAASERTLEYAFREYCGVTPKAYLNARRLHAFREALRSPEAQSVSSVAGEFGYWHMGKLAGDYRAAFGELPSETLRGAN